MATKTYSKMTLEELEAEITSLNKQRDELKAKLRQVVNMRNGILAKERAAKTYEQMPAAEREAMAQIVQAQGVESEETFGEL